MQVAAQLNHPRPGDVPWVVYIFERTVKGIAIPFSDDIRTVEICSNTTKTTIAATHTIDRRGNLIYIPVPEGEDQAALFILGFIILINGVKFHQGRVLVDAGEDITQILGDQTYHFPHRPSDVLRREAYLSTFQKGQEISFITPFLT